MAILGSLLFFLAVPAAIAAALAYGLPILLPSLSLRLRSVIAALISGGMMIAIPVSALLDDSGLSGDALYIPMITMAATGLFVALVVGLPVALMVGKRADARKDRSKTFD